MATVAITQDQNDIGRAVAGALGHLPLEPLVRGKLVAVKADETYATPGDTAGVTRPDTLRAVLRELKRFGPRALVVTGGAGAAETDDVFRTAGRMAVVRAEGAEFVDHNRPPFAEVALGYAPGADVDGPQRSVTVNPRVLGYETLVSLAPLKLHETATVTLGLKDVAMSLPAADHYGHPRSTQKHKNHFFADMHSFVAAMAKRFPTRLAVIAGHPAMIGTGPLGGHAVETGPVVASTDPLAADAAGARLPGFRSQAVRHPWEAGRLGVGEADTDRMDFPALSLKEASGAFTAAAYVERLTFEHA